MFTPNQSATVTFATGKGGSAINLCLFIVFSPSPQSLINCVKEHVDYSSSRTVHIATEHTYTCDTQKLGQVTHSHSTFASYHLAPRPPETQIFTHRVGYKCSTKSDVQDSAPFCLIVSTTFAENFETFHGRSVAYFPRRGSLSIASTSSSQKLGHAPFLPSLSFITAPFYKTVSAYQPLLIL